MLDVTEAIAVAQVVEFGHGAALIDLRSMMLAVPERLTLRFELGADQLVPVSKQTKSRRRSS